MNLRNGIAASPPVVELYPAGTQTEEQIEERKLPVGAGTNIVVFIIWNSREDGSDTFRRQCGAMVNSHKPSMLVIYETKMT